MHGLIFATWERFLGERYGEVVLGVYRDTVEGTEASIPLATRIYQDEILLAGVAAASTMTGIAVNVILREYGRYFITNGLTGHICSHLLESVHSARDLLLVMRSAHKQLNNSSADIIPPLFRYEPLTGLGIRIIYDSHRRLCPLLCGAIEGAGMRYGEEIAIKEVSCMRHGEADCQFDVSFLGKFEMSSVTDEHRAVNVKRNEVAEMLFHMLPSEGRGITLCEASNLASLHGYVVRPSQIAGIMRQLQNVGLVILSAKQTGDMFYEREYLRVSKFESGAGRLLLINVS